MLQVLGDWLSGAVGLGFILAAVLLVLWLDVSDEAVRTQVGGHVMSWVRRRRTRTGSRLVRLALALMLLGAVASTVARLLPAVA